jgi:hypothetical protein
MQSAAALAILSVSSKTGLASMDRTNVNSTLDMLANQLAHNPDAFFQHPFSFTWWLRGGEPGSPSDNLVLQGDHGQVKGTYIRARFDPKHQPPVHSETFSGVVPLHRVSNILTLLFESSVLREPVNEDHGEGEMRDAQEESWRFQDPKVDLTKTLFEPFPKAIEPMRALCLEIAEQLVPSHSR